MKVLFVASEAAPFISTGGLGDVIGSLPLALKDISQEINVACVIPYHKAIPENLRTTAIKVRSLSFYLGWRNTGADVYWVNYKGIDYYFIENE